MMIAPIALLAIKLNVASLFGKPNLHESKVTCHIKTVSYKFVGQPGFTFLYAGEQYSVPASGWIELLAVGGPAVYRVGARELPLEVWPKDEFGTRTVPLPSTPNPSATVAEK